MHVGPPPSGARGFGLLPLRVRRGERHLARRHGRAGLGPPRRRPREPRSTSSAGSSARRAGASFYEEYTGRLGFRMHSDEGKVMGLAAYGDAGGRDLPVHRARRPRRLSVLRQARSRRGAREVKPPRRDEHPINGVPRARRRAAPVQPRAGDGAHHRSPLRAHRHHRLLPCRRHRAELLVERQAARAAARRAPLRAACRRRLRERRSARPSYAHVQRTGSRPSTTFDHAYWGPEYSNDEIRDGARPGEGRLPRTSTTSARATAACSRRTRSSAGSRAEWRSAREPSARAASSPTRRTRE